MTIGNFSIQSPTLGAVSSLRVNSGGAGYTVGDVLTVVGGTGTAALIKVNTVSAGVIVSAYCVLNNFGNYTVFPTNPVAATGGTGSGATFLLTQNTAPLALSSGVYSLNYDTLTMNPQMNNTAPSVFRTTQFAVDPIARCTFINSDAASNYDGGSGFGAGAPALMVTSTDLQAIDARCIPVAAPSSTAFLAQLWTLFFPTGATLPDGFGVRLQTRIRPISSGLNGTSINTGRIDFVRDGADNSSRLNLTVFNAGTPLTVWSAAHDGTLIGSSKTIQSIADPVNTQDVATKNYVDTKLLTPNTGVFTTSSGSTTLTPTNNGLLKVACNLSSTYTITTAGAVDGQRLTVQFRQDATGSRTVAFDSTVAFGTDIPSFTATTTVNKLDIVTFVFSSTLTKWMLTAAVKGF